MGARLLPVLMHAKTNGQPLGGLDPDGAVDAVAEFIEDAYFYAHSRLGLGVNPLQQHRQQCDIDQPQVGLSTASDPL
jgi:hypothetical protein